MRIVDTQEYLDTVCGMLREGAAAVPVPVAGTSMCPFLHPGDTVYLDLLTHLPKKGDIVLFTRASGQYILHRISAVNPDGSYFLLGDNQMTKEPVPGVERIHAIVTAARVGDKMVRPGSFRWWVYAHVWLWLTPWRGKLAALHSRLRRKGKGEKL